MGAWKHIQVRIQAYDIAWFKHQSILQCNGKLGNSAPSIEDEFTLVHNPSTTAASTMTTTITTTTDWLIDIDAQNSITLR